MFDSGFTNAFLIPCHSKGMAKNVFNQGTFTLVNSTELTGSSINEQVCCPINRRNGCWEEMGRVRAVAAVYTC